MSEISGQEQLKSKTTLKEILEVATEFERTARDFYTDLIPKVRKNLRYLVEELNTRENYFNHEGHEDNEEKTFKFFMLFMVKSGGIYE